MFNIFKKNKKTLNKKNDVFKSEIELTASVLAYEVARSDGGITTDELELLNEEIKKITNKD